MRPTEWVTKGLSDGTSVRVMDGYRAVYWTYNASTQAYQRVLATDPCSFVAQGESTSVQLAAAAASQMGLAAATMPAEVDHPATEGNGTVGAASTHKVALRIGYQLADLIEVWGYFKLDWEGTTTRGDRDYVALYGPDGDTNNKDDYLTLQWQWATRGTSFVPGTLAGHGYAAVYWRWDGSQYVKAAETPRSYFKQWTALWR